MQTTVERLNRRRTFFMDNDILKRALEVVVLPPFHRIKSLINLSDCISDLTLSFFGFWHVCSFLVDQANFLHATSTFWRVGLAGLIRLT